MVAAAIGTTLLYAGVGALVGDTAARHVGLGSLLFTAALYDLLLAPFTVPLIMALARRAENDPLAESQAAAGGDVASGWLAAGTGLRIGNQRGGLRLKAARAAPAAAGSRGSSDGQDGTTHSTRPSGRAAAVSNIPETGRTPRVQIRLVVIQILVFSLLLTLGGRLWYLQIRNGDEYTDEAQEQPRPAGRPARRARLDPRRPRACRSPTTRPGSSSPPAAPS